MKKYLKLIIILLIIGLFVVFYRMGLKEYLSLEALKANKDILNTYYQNHRVIFIVLYMLTYIISTAISLPGATILTLAGGFLFGPLLGSVIIIVSATIGASFAFLAARFILRDMLEAKYKDSLAKFNDGIGIGNRMIQLAQHTAIKCSFCFSSFPSEILNISYRA